MFRLSRYLTLILKFTVIIVLSSALQIPEDNSIGLEVNISSSLFRSQSPSVKSSIDTSFFSTWGSSCGGLAYMTIIDIPYFWIDCEISFLILLIFNIFSLIFFWLWFFLCFFFILFLRYYELDFGNFIS